MAEDRRQIAEDAISLVIVDYEELLVVNAEDAIKPGAPQLHDDAPKNIIYGMGMWQ